MMFKGEYHTRFFYKLYLFEYIKGNTKYRK